MVAFAGIFDRASVIVCESFLVPAQSALSHWRARRDCDARDLCRECAPLPIFDTLEALKTT